MWSKWATGPKYAQIHATFYLTICCNHLCEMVSRMDGTQWIEKSKCQFKKNHLPWQAGKLDLNSPKITQSHALFLGIAVNIQIYQIIPQFGFNGPNYATLYLMITSFSFPQNFGFWTNWSKHFSHIIFYCFTF